MPLITIKIVGGKTVEEKRGLVKDVTEAVTKNTGAPPEAVSIDIVEYGLENLAHGGELLLDNPPPGLAKGK